MLYIYWLGVLIVTICNYSPRPGRKLSDLAVALIIGLLWPALVIMTIIMFIIAKARKEI